ncbi:hypothetical protein PanWU01x14_338210 [Parasponia andersonii]|uniref:Uncharacterized protein n=1 Tax=Parasponia andersonii TaxID=3476 RepID=A0A2P5AFC2_PARAD|nr:hypothetical protein PanWU01x14_338210 [Parasponia andersonii]
MVPTIFILVRNMFQAIALLRVRGQLVEGPCEVATQKYRQITTTTLIVMMILPSTGCEGRIEHGGDDHDGEEEEEEEAKMEFIFQINEHGFGTQLHEEKGQKGGPNNIDSSLSSFIPLQ